LKRRDEWMHLPPEAERLLPQLLARLAGPERIDPTAEVERIERLLLAGDPERWLAYLRERSELLLDAAHRPPSEALSREDLPRLAGILRDQLAMIQVTLDLGAEDLALLDRLEKLEAGAAAE
jgi:hypothetical protein